MGHDHANEVARLRAQAVEASGSGLVIADMRQPDHPIIDVNPAFERLTGYEAGEIIGRNCRILQGPDTDPAARNQMRDAVAAGRTCQVILLNYRKDGAPFWNQVRLSPLRDAAGQVTYFFGSQRDVSERIQTDEALEESERKYRLLFEGNPLPMWVFDVETGAFLAVNDAAVHHYGFTRDEFRRMTIFDVRPAEDVPAIQKKMAQVAASPNGLDVAGIWRHRRKDGRFVEMDVTTHAVTFGGRAARLATAYDVAAGRHAAEALEVSEARFHALLDNTAAVVFVKDQSGRYQLINRQFERLYHMTQAQAIGQTDYDLFPRDVADVLRRNDRAVLETQRALEVEEQAPLDGEMRTYLSLKFPLIDARGHPYAVCGVSTDITARIRTEEALRWSRERLELAQHASEIGTFEWNVQGGSVAWSPELENLYGLAPGGFGGRYENWVETLHPDDRDLAEAAVQRAAASGADLDIEFRIVWPDQSTHWIAARGRSFFDDDGTPLRLVGINMDITAQKAAEEAALRLAAIVESSDDAIVSSSLDQRFVSWNSGAERLYGYTAAEAIGQTASLIVPPDRTSEVAMVFDRLVRGEPIDHYETVRVRKDGRRIDVSVSMSPLHNRAGKLVGLSSIDRDVTQRRRAEESQRFLVEASEVLASSLDHETTLRAVARLAVPHLADWCVVHLVAEDESVEQLTAAHADPARVDSAKDLERHFPYDPTARHGVPEVLRTGQPELYPEVTDQELVAFARTADQLAIPRSVGLQSAMIVPMVTRGRSIGAISLLVAESDRRYGPADLALAMQLAHLAAAAVDNARLYHQAQDAVRARDHFLSIAAHELRTPIAGVKGYAQMLSRARERNRLDEAQLAYGLRTINTATDRLAALTNDLLDVSRIRLGELPLRRQRVALADVCGTIVDRYEEQRGGGRHRFRFDSGGPCSAAVDVDRIEQVLTNLLDNAINYSPGGGDVRLTLRAEDDGVLLQVRDEGIGLPAAAADAIFTPFGRAANATRQNLPGLGLGLYICKNIVERHGGRIWAESAGEGEGTTMSVWLPA